MFNSVFLVRASQNGSQQGAADSVSGTVLCLGKNSISNSFISIPLSHAGLGDVNEHDVRRKVYHQRINAA